MNKYLKNIDYASVLSMAELVPYQPGQIVSRTLVQSQSLGMTLFGFDKGEQISAHESKGDALVTVMDGRADITVGETVYSVGAGQSIVMPAGVPHGFYAPQPHKLVLLVFFPI